MKRTREQAINAIITYFEENPEIFNEAIEELNSYNAYLGDDVVCEMEMLNELFSGCDNIEILNRAFFGRDDETWHTDASGEKIYGPFNPNRDYFYFDGYGNLVSCDYKDYSSQLDKYAVEAMSENKQYIDAITDGGELEQLFNELDEAEA